MKRGVFPLPSKAQSSSSPAVPASALQRSCLQGKAGNVGDTVVEESRKLWWYYSLKHNIELQFINFLYCVPLNKFMWCKCLPANAVTHPWFQHICPNPVMLFCVFLDSERSHLSSFTMKLKGKFHSPKIKRTPSKKGKQVDLTVKTPEKSVNKVRKGHVLFS